MKTGKPKLHSFKGYVFDCFNYPVAVVEVKIVQSGGAIIRNFKTDNRGEYVVKDIVKKDEKKYVDFFNKAQPLSTRMHQIELLPGVGKKHMWQIIDARKEKEFETFKDIKKRGKLMPDPEKAIIRRILLELQGKEKHRLFVDL